MEIDNKKVVFSIRLDSEIVKEAALRYPDKTVLEAFCCMGILSLEEKWLH